MAFDPEMIERLILASVLGGLIGLEREIHGRPAGFRTHLLVSLGSCLFVTTSLEFYHLYGGLSGAGSVRIDPARVAAQIIPGIGFLGAGAIIREGSSIRGLTTAACLWVAAAIGLACGIGLYGISLVVTAISLVTLLLLKRVEGWLKRDTYSTVRIWSNDLEGQMSKIEGVLRGCALQILDVNVEKDMIGKELFLEFQVKFSAGDSSCSVVDSIVSIEGIRKVRLD